MSELKLLGGEPCLLDRTVEINGVETLLAALTAEEKTAALVDPSMAIRHFRACKGNAAKALASVRDTLAWRQEFQVDRLVQATQPPLEDDREFHSMLALENETGKVYTRGYDKDGRVLLFLRQERENTFNEAHNMKHLVWNLEKAIACTRRKSTRKGSAAIGKEKILLILDFRKFSLGSAPPMSTSKTTLHILQAHYPERVARIYCFHAPFVFKAFWALIKPFVDPTTKAKIVFVAGAAALQAFHDEFDDLGALEGFMGGTAVDKLGPWDSANYVGLPFDVCFDEKDVDGS